MKDHNLSDLPQIETLLQDPGAEDYISLLSRPIVTDIARGAVEEARHKVLTGTESVPSYSELRNRFLAACRYTASQRLRRVVNATGIIIHTNMGRAPLSPEVWNEAAAVNCGYSNLELNLATGKRGKRKGLIPDLLTKLTGSEDALVVNNNAAAVFLILSVFGKGKEVIVSRGEQVQIGGGFRIPDILQSSGARLVEIGTTNITTLDDYSSALSEETAMILSVHRSNFAIRGFTGTPSVRELSAVKPEGVILCVDQGSGVTTEELPGETSIRSYLDGGADLVCFSGDKVFGGPQAGIIAGRKSLIENLERHPLMRVFRPGKTVYSLLEAVLVRKLNGQKSSVAESLDTPIKELRRRGKRLLANINRDKAAVIESSCTTGGGSSPDETFPSLSIIISIDANPESILQELRESDPPIIGTISSDKVHLNLATIRDAEIPHVRKQLQRITGE